MSFSEKQNFDFEPGLFCCCFVSFETGSFSVAPAILKLALLSRLALNSQDRVLGLKLCIITLGFFLGFVLGLFV